LDSKNEFEK
jgi:hypothetical protein